MYFKKDKNYIKNSNTIFILIKVIDPRIIE